MAQTAPAKRDEKLPKPQSDAMAAAAVIYKGQIVVLNSSGYAVKGSATTGLVVRGVAIENRDNADGAAGDLRITSKSGCFGFKNSVSDAVTIAEIEDVVFIEDDETVCKTASGKSVCGILKSIEESKAWVQIGAWPLQVGLLAASNLSDVGSAATARANIGANKGALEFSKISSKASDAEVARWVAPRAGTVINVRTILNAALATADATAQLKINGTNVGSTTTGLVTITQASSAAGDVDVATPLTTNLTFVAGDIISLTVGGGSTATGTFNATLEFSY